MASIFFLDIAVGPGGWNLKFWRSSRSRRRGGITWCLRRLPEVVMEFKARSAIVPVGLRVQASTELALWREFPADFVIVHYPLITRKLVRMIHQTAHARYLPGR